MALVRSRLFALTAENVVETEAPCSHDEVNQSQAQVQERKFLFWEGLSGCLPECSDAHREGNEEGGGSREQSEHQEEPSAEFGKAS